MKREKENVEQLKTMIVVAQRYARKYGRVRGCEVDDLVQLTMLRLLNRTSDRATTTGWLYKAVRSVVFDALRQLQREQKHVATMEDGWFTGESCERADEYGRIRLYDRQIVRDDVAGPEDWPAIKKALDKLTPCRRQVLLLRAGGYSYREIAELTGASIGTVRSRLHHAKQQAAVLLRDLR